MTAKEFPGGGYDLVTIFDALHDMGDPVGASAHVLESLADGSPEQGDGQNHRSEARDFRGLFVREKPAPAVKLRVGFSIQASQQPDGLPGRATNGIVKDEHPCSFENQMTGIICSISSSRTDDRLM